MIEAIVGVNQKFTIVSPKHEGDASGEEGTGLTEIEHRHKQACNEAQSEEASLVKHRKIIEDEKIKVL